jgi:endonuclease YncB( thermonuclease family)
MGGIVASLMRGKSASRQAFRAGTAVLALAALALAGPLAPAARRVRAEPRPAAAQAAEPARAPAELCDVVDVVDADTLRVLRGGRVEKLRLLSVDTEEKLGGSPSASASKPETLFGEECALWARAFFAGLAEGDAPPRVALLLPGGAEQRDAYGRLLCHVLLPDGTDFNLLLVESGRSPYFNKYGNSTVCHPAFVAAQERARAAQRGIWDPATNRPATTGAPSAARPYDRLLPWWQARAGALDAFSARCAREPEACADAQDPAALQRALAWCEGDAGRAVEVFGEPERFFDEDDGGWTVLFRTGDAKCAFRARVPAARRAALAPLDLVGSAAELRQNYWSVTGRLRRGTRGRGGFELEAGDPRQWRPGGPEPRLPAPAPAQAGD